MRTISLTQNQIAFIDDGDYEFLMQWKWCALFAKGINGFYAGRTDKRENPKTVLMHRVIMNLSDSKIFIDHKDHDGLNNCRSNLRIVTSAQNSANRRSRSNSTSKYLGVTWHTVANKWQAQIMKDYKKTYIGLFNNQEEAALAYNSKAIEVHGQFANLNKINL